MKILHTDTVDPREIRALLTRSATLAAPEKEAAVRAIIDDVRDRGDAALMEYGRRWDCPSLEHLRVPEDEIVQAHAACDPALLETIRASKSNIERFHRQQMPRSWFDAEQAGIILGQLVQPVRRAGLYVPGGTAAYPSTVLMTAVPALVAGVEELVLCSPASPDGTVNPLVLAAAHECGITKVYAAGGAAAIGAMAFGTDSIPQVDVICGPGNIYVLLAKKLVVGTVNIESLPGPSEICVVADETANARFVAADLLSQAEHGGVGAHSTAVLITTSSRLAEAVRKEALEQAASQKRRGILEEALAESGLIIVASGVDEALELANVMAPEHLELEIADPWTHLHQVRNAGAIMIGPWSTEPVADYWAGPSHVLPTGGSARFYGPLSVDIFLKKSSIVCYDRKRLLAAAPHVIRFAEAEGLAAHANAVRVRLEDDES